MTLPPCPFCHTPPTKNYAFVFCSNPLCRLSYASSTGNRSHGHRPPVLFSLKEWLQLLPKKNMIIHLIHKLICRYLRHCSGSFHCYPYGPKGRYVVLMNEDQYHQFQKSIFQGTNSIQ